MPATSEPNRRSTFALTAAVAATTVAVGVTAATLLGWFRGMEPRPTATAAPPPASVVYVPVAPTTSPEPPALLPAETPNERVALDEPRERDAEREHDDNREGDDD